MKSLPLLLEPMKKCQMAGEITLGRGEDNTITVMDPAVSRLQAVIHQEEEGMVIRNLGRNSFQVNHLPVTGKRNLLPGDLIELPGCRIIFLGRYLAIGLEKGKLNKIARISASDLRDEAKEKAGEQIYHRFPRNRISMDLTPVEIDGPPSVQREHIPSLLMLIGQNCMMALPMMIGSVFMIYAFSVSMGKSDLTMYAGLVSASLTMFFSILWAVISRTAEKSRAQKEEGDLIRAYRKYLLACEKKLKDKAQKCREVLSERYPCANDCILLAGSGLWNRDPVHDDFLKHRIGSGDLPLPFEVRMPKESFSMEEKGLWKRLGEIREDCRFLSGLPVLLDFTVNEQVGIVGEEKGRVYALLRALLVQLSSTISYRDLKIGFIYSKEEKSNWDFLRWMPHVWSRGKRERYLADNQVRIRALCENVLARIRETGRKGRDSETDPWFFLFVTDPDLIAQEALYTYLEQAEKLEKTRVIWAAKRREDLPFSCDCILEQGAGYQRTYAAKGQEISEENFSFDQMDYAGTESFMREISGWKLREFGGKDLPDVISFFEMEGIRDPDDLDIGSRWKENDTSSSIHALIGFKEGSRVCHLDLHEKYHGPHGLIAGMTGSGKSEMIASLILSLSLNYSPQSLNFFLIDYKGGGMSTLFEGLPHICGEISNLSGNLVHRAMLSIKSECRRRQKIFRKHHALSINEYTRLFQEGQVREALPHLVIIIDEFAEMKREEPDFMKELISVAQVGRSLGVHLILSTQKPAGTVDDNIWSNSRFRICLRVQDRQDSMDMLHTSDAASIRQIGRGYLQVGHNERYEFFQSAWSNAPGRPADYDAAAVARVHLDGRKEMVYEDSGQKKEEKTQLMILLDMIRKAAKEKEIPIPHSLWSDPLPRVMTVPEKPADAPAARVGWFDDPEEQTRHPFLIDIRHSGNILICGLSASGKSSLLTTMLYSLCQSLSPGSLNLFVLDAGGGALHVLRFFPHVGDYLTSEETEKSGRVIRRMEKELERRKKLLKGISFLTYSKTHPDELPYILLVIDGFAAAREKWEKDSEDRLMRLLANGSRHGILILMTAMGLEGPSFLSRAGGCFQTKIALALKDRYSYGDFFGLLSLPVYPEKGIAGRGIARMGEKILEFQTGLYFDPEDDLKRQEEMIKAGKEYAASYRGPKPEETRILPSRPKWKNFYREAVSQGICCGYCRESAAPLPMDPFFCLLISGEEGQGKEDAFFMILAFALKKRDSKVCIFSTEKKVFDLFLDGRIYAGMRGAEDIFHFFDRLGPLLADRKKNVTCKDTDHYYIFIDNMPAFLHEVYEGDYEMSGFMENVFEKGDQCGVSFIAAAGPGQYSVLEAYPAFRVFCSHETGIHMGGELIDHPFARTMGLTPQEELTRLPARTGHYLRKDRRPVEVLIPETTANDLC